MRTLQDMFGLADPAVDASYLNRAKYTEAFIAANITALPEFAGSADTHFDSVRPINHAYKIPAGYVQKLNPAGHRPAGAASRGAGADRPGRHPDQRLVAEVRTTACGAARRPARDGRARMTGPFTTARLLRLSNPFHAHAVPCSDGMRIRRPRFQAMKMRKFSLVAALAALLALTACGGGGSGSAASSGGASTPASGSGTGTTRRRR